MIVGCSRRGISRMKLAIAAGSLLALFGIASTASALTIDFEGLGANVNIENVNLGGVAISIAGSAEVRTSVGTPGGPLTGSRAIVGNPGTHANPFVGQFLGALAGNVNFVSIALGDFGADSDNLYLRAYNSANGLIGTDFDFLPSGENGGRILSLSVAGIDRIEFGSTGAFENSVLADNLTFEWGTLPNTNPTPEPSSIVLLGSGLAGIIVWRRKKGNV
ncbi:PEP-CTERM sorting domain-containing protein [Candidatus Nitronereus thalassa]|uniref:PEP-CTERM sorting domain-containing protein n=1 Tax=Candidatus Nitronereus thalassa TaxID=3020898 RepID=A0ABU3KBZ7_9BACT|nr:PEP-CTERM sorting domain-containing protein [Candidatus Nitronereus thalassa]MDT7044024.1 PEP-CTERM sorting domain-containing protein [Candidatus Nitronereus thalassa]